MKNILALKKGSDILIKLNDIFMDRCRLRAPSCGLSLVFTDKFISDVTHTF